eukprot:CAMPEP_0194103908 /NCGR_PEP_ID=MMETSP0150-20130528/4264_1 /TAXON_ID=122233 /ORGANISM="Chaetoceros debilis, Strain MM31A-1" /LENGTH=563 /DNA_ID=CAMNT_0038791255 /DNA_START=156 /DNA_END=1847 /DNA_ORIENTATION=-
MSDDEYSYHYSDASDQEMDGDDNSQEEDDDEGFDYTDDEEEQEGCDDAEVNLENEYYNAKGLRDTEDDDDPASSIAEAHTKFESAIAMEINLLGDGKMGPWTFKCLKQIMKLRLRFEEYDEAKTLYARILDCISSPKCEGVSPNAMEKGINGMLDRVSALFQGAAATNTNVKANANVGTDAGGNSAADSKGKPQDLARHVYDSTLKLFHPRYGSCPNERLWFKTNLKFGQLLYENHETYKLQDVIRDLLQTSDMSSSSSSTSKTHLMEIYALQIQLYSRLKDNAKLREIFDQAMKVQGGIPHPRTLALIQELGGKMHMSSGEYEAANTTFYQAFKSYDEAGDIARLRCLKYLVLASMLHASSINPFDSQEVRPYRKDPEIVAMTNLVDAFHNNDIGNFEGILKKNWRNIMNDEFIAEYIPDLLKTIRTQVLLQVVKPYTRISLAALSKELNGISIKDVENLLVPLILDGKLEGRIDQVNGFMIKTVNLDPAGEDDGSDEADSSNEMNVAINNKESKIPQWGSNTVSVRTCDAIEYLMSELDALTVAVASSVGTVQNETESIRR